MMKRPTRMPWLVLPFLLSLPLATLFAGRPVNPLPPVSPEDAAGAWVGVEEVYHGLYRLMLNPDGSGLLGYTHPRAEPGDTDLYRLSGWDQDNDKVKLTATSLGDETRAVKVDGKVTRDSVRLTIQVRRGNQHRVQMIREEEFDAAIARVRAAMDGLAVSGGSGGRTVDAQSAPNFARRE